MLETINLTKKYEDGHLAVDHLSFKSNGRDLLHVRGQRRRQTTTINLFLNSSPDRGTA